MVRLPPEGAHWETRECDLWFRTRGRFHPRRSVGEHRPQPTFEARRFSGGPFGPPGCTGRVSVVAPTTEGRQEFHQKLWACFNAQTWPDKELVVVETYQIESSEFLLAKAKVDRRLTYVRYRVGSEDDWSIGLKRNVCANLATGQFIAHFDDDDFYAPTYLDTMIENIKKSGTLAIKLSRWYVLDLEEEDRFYYCDPMAFGSEPRDAEEWLLSQFTTLSTMGSTEHGEKTYGWGFSYVYLRSVVLELPFEDKSMGEDWAFYSSVMREKGCHSVALLEDTTGICLHLQHGLNTSKSLGVASRKVLADEVSDLDVADLQSLFPARPSHSPLQVARKGWSLPEEQPAPPARPRRRVTVHGEGRSAEVSCSKGATAREMIELLDQDLTPAGGLVEVYRVPALGEVSEAVLQEQLRAAFRMVAPGLCLPASAATEPWKQFQGELQLALARARGAVPLDERLGSSCSEFWVSSSVIRSETAVRVVCQATPADPGGFKAFHVDLTLDGTVREFRELLGAALPSDASVFAEKSGRGLVTLHDGEITPSVVTVSAYMAPINLRMVLTRRISRTMQVIMKNLLMKEDAQRQIAEFEAQAGEKRQVFRILLSNFLSKEIYPEAMRPFGLQEMFEAFRFMEVYHAINMETDLIHNESFVKAWMELEELMHNWEALPYAKRTLGETLFRKNEEEQGIRSWAQDLCTAVENLPPLPAAKENELHPLLEVSDPVGPGCRQRWHLGVSARRLTCAFWLQASRGQVPEDWMGPICETLAGKDFAGLFQIMLQGKPMCPYLQVAHFGSVAAPSEDGRYPDGGPWLEFSQDLADGAFHHLAVLYDADALTCELFVDGGCAELLRFQCAQPVRLTDVLLGKRSPLTPLGQSMRWPHGRLKDVKIWARCLSEEEVARLYHTSRHRH